MGLCSSDERLLHEGYGKCEIRECVLKLQARVDIFDRFRYDETNKWTLAGQHDLLRILS